MRQAILRGPRALDLIEVPVPIPGSGEVVVRVRAALTCGTDLKTYRQGHPRLPFGPFGHEAAGDVEYVGEGVQGVSPGDPVVFTPTAACLECGPCRRGHENLCERLFDAIALGAYGDLILLPARVTSRHLFAKPQTLSYIEAAFLEPLACVLHGWNRVGATSGHPVAVVGMGSIGLLHVREASRRGLEVIAVGRRPAALALAERAGARYVVNMTQTDAGQALRALTGEGPEVLVECTGSVDVWRAAPSWVAPGGRVLLFGGLPKGSTPGFDATRLHYGEVDLINTFHYRTGDVREALALLGSGAIRPAEFITDVRPLGDIRQVFDDLDRGIGVKYAILPDGNQWR
ncbi:MAG: zinc-binding dehydrogenase [Armatimonadetes bacterium]|nr:zinc-binding dehydrogenase [Armatimonadota bacterium]